MHPTTHLARNKRGIWEIRWTDRDERGQSHGYKASTGQTEEPAARAYQAQWLKARSEALVTLSTPTVEDIIEGYLADCRGRGVRSSQSYIAKRVARALGMYRPGDLAGAVLREYRAQRLAEAAANTVRRELGVLTSALNWAADPDGGGMIAAGDVPKITLPGMTQDERRFLDEAAEEEFHARALVYRGRRGRIPLYVALGLNTGARKEAIEQLDWDRVDLAAGVINFRVPGTRLTKKRRVPVPINDRLRAVLEKVPEAKRHGKVVGDGDMRRQFASFVKRTPWPWVTSHIMRHTFVTLLLRSGVTVWDVAQLVGDTPEIISKHYGHHQSDWHLRAAANKRFA